MMSRNLLNRKISSRFLAGLLVCGFILAPISHTHEIKIAHAQLVVTDPGNAILNTVTSVEQTIATGESILQTGFQSGGWVKEYVLDGIVWVLINKVLEGMVQSVTTWVNSGFKGSPAFVTDLSGFLTDVADSVAGDFIYGTPLAALCSPFKLDIQLALNLQYQDSREGRTGGYKAQCKLSEVVDNMEGFLDGDFTAGGWDGWFAMTQTRGNNPYGALIEAQSKLAVRVSNAQGDELELTRFGRGFLTMKDCKPSATAGSPDVCTNVTPGAVIESTLNKSLASGQERLTVADEIDELVGALFAQLANNVLSGAGGLLGLTNSNYGSGDYFEQMAAERPPAGSAQASSGTLDAAISVEQKYLSLEQQVIALIDTAATYKDDRYGQSNSCDSGDLTASLTGKRTTAQSEVVLTIENINTVSSLKTDLNLLENSNTSASVISALLTKYRASSIQGAEANLMGMFANLQTSGSLHTASDSTRLELQSIPALKDEIELFTDSVDATCP